MAIIVKHPFVSTVPDSTDTSLVRPSNWNADHTVTGLGTAAELNAGVANGVATLDSSGKVPVSQMPQMGDLNYQGTWNASTNTPTLASGTGTKGYYYVVSVAGTINLNGITDWQIGDWAVFNGTAWQKIDNTDLVTSVNGYTGAVNLTYTDVGAFPATATTGTGNVVLQNGPTMSAPIIDGANPYIQFNNGSAVTVAAGKLWYNGTTGSWNAGMGGGNITQQIGEELFVYGKASTAITDSPLKIVYQTGTVGASGVITFAPTVAGITNGDLILGCATENIALNGTGRITSFGVIHGITTDGSAYSETWANGDVIWYNPVTGNPTNVKPSAPNIKVAVGTIINAGSGGSGSIQVEINHGSVLGGTDSNVQFTSLVNNNLLQYDSTAQYWKNVTPASISGIGSATNIANGSANQVPYQSGAGATTFSSNLTFNGTTLATTGISDSGNLTFTGTGNRITGDFSNATLANRVAFQTSTANGNSTPILLPNGTATVSGLLAFNNSDPTNASFGSIFAIGSTEIRVNSGITGTGTYLPMTFYTGGSERVRVDTSGNVGIGLNNTGGYGKLHVAGSGYQAMAVSSSDASGVVTVLAANSSSEARLGTFTNHPLAIYTNSTERMRIAADGTVFLGAGSVGAKFCPYYISSTNYAALSSASDGSMTFITGISSPAERMRVDPNGNVGIGTTSAGGDATNRSVTASGSASASFNSVCGSVTAIYAATSSNALLGTSTNHPVVFYANNAEKMRIDTSGNVGIGTNSPSAKLAVVGTGYSPNITLTDAATIAWDTSTGQTATFTFVSSNRTMGAPTNLVNGGFYALAVIQNGGSNTLTWNSVFKWSGSSAPTLSTAAGAKDYFVFRSDGTNLYEQGRSLGVA